MSVAEISRLHGQYIRLSDKFKAFWTYNQFAAGVYKNLLHAALPYQIQFQVIYDAIRGVSDVIQSGSSEALPKMEKVDKELQRAAMRLLQADAEIGPSILRRFFEKLRQQDEKIVYNLIKFYLYAEAYHGPQRDKLDFLLTKVGEEYLEDRREYVVRDLIEVRRQLQGLLSAGPAVTLPPEETLTIVKSIRRLREEIESAESFEDLTEQKLLQRGRHLKHSIGDAYLHPDVLLNIIECNIATKNRFQELYHTEEERIIEHATRLVSNEESIARSFGESNPALIEELSRFKNFKEQFDESRANSNLKHDVIARLKTSMNAILAELESELVHDRPAEGESPILVEAQQGDMIEARFGDDPLLHPFLMRIVSVLDYFGEDAAPERVARAPEARGLRLEPWEAAAYQKLFCARPMAEGEGEPLMKLFLRAGALRLKIDEEARAMIDQAPPPPELLRNVRESLDRARQLDVDFKDQLQESMYESNSRLLRFLYRSRLRLLRAFSGLWLIYDQHVDREDVVL